MNAKTAKQLRKLAWKMAKEHGLQDTPVLYNDKTIPIQLFAKDKDGNLAPYMGTTIVSRRLNQACVRKIYKDLKKGYKNS